jgi:hypothetical protein
MFNAQSGCSYANSYNLISSSTQNIFYFITAGDGSGDMGNSCNSLALNLDSLGSAGSDGTEGIISPRRVELVVTAETGIDCRCFLLDGCSGSTVPIADTLSEGQISVSASKSVKRPLTTEVPMTDMGRTGVFLGTLEDPVKGCCVCMDR